MHSLRRTWPLAALFTLVFAGNATATHAEPADFASDAQLIHRTVACGEDGTATKPSYHCRILHKKYGEYRRKFLAKARPFIAKLRPEGLPTKVVYPFGGGDLLSAIATYPDATEITTLSLESAGDATRLAKLPAKKLPANLRQFRRHIIYLLWKHDSLNTNLKSFERGAIPGQLSFSLMAAAIYGYRPTSLRYFRVESDGSLHYYTRAEIAQLGARKGRRLDGQWVHTDFSIAFRNMEVRYERVGSGSGPARLVHRHIAANLSDGALAKTGVIAHLKRKGTISAMTKAASYLLWRDDFSKIRDYLLGNMAWMIADSTGILPHHARAAGWEPVTYGKFTAAFLPKGGGKHAAIMRKLWKSQPRRTMPFRYGYSDVNGAPHLLILQRKR